MHFNVLLIFYAKHDIAFGGMLIRELESNWPRLLEAIGLWMPDDVIHIEHNDKPENEPDFGNVVGHCFFCS